MHASADVGGKFDDLDDLAGLVRDRIIRRCKIDLTTILRVANDIADPWLVCLEITPEILVFSVTIRTRLYEDTVILAFEFGKREPCSLEEILVGDNDFTVGFEFYDCLRPADCQELVPIVDILDPGFRICPFDCKADDSLISLERRDREIKCTMTHPNRRLMAVLEGGKH